MSVNQRYHACRRSSTRLDFTFHLITRSPRKPSANPAFVKLGDVPSAPQIQEIYSGTKFRGLNNHELDKVEKYLASCAIFPLVNKRYRYHSSLQQGQGHLHHKSSEKAVRRKLQFRVFAVLEMRLSSLSARPCHAGRIIRPPDIDVAIAKYLIHRLGKLDYLCTVNVEQQVSESQRSSNDIRRFLQSRCADFRVLFFPLPRFTQSIRGL